MGGHVEVEQAATVVADQEEDVEGLEGQGLDYEEVSCPDGLSVVGEEWTCPDFVDWLLLDEWSGTPAHGLAAVLTG